MIFQNIRMTRAANMETIAKLMRQQESQEQTYRSMALDLITCPKTRNFVENTTIIENLFAYGHDNRKLRFPGEGKDFFESVTEVRARMEKLYSFWKGSVSVNVDICDESMVELTFTVKSLFT